MDEDKTFDSVEEITSEAVSEMKHFSDAISNISVVISAATAIMNEFNLAMKKLVDGRKQVFGKNYRRLVHLSIYAKKWRARKKNFKRLFII